MHATDELELYSTAFSNSFGPHTEHELNQSFRRLNPFFLAPNLSIPLPVGRDFQTCDSFNLDFQTSYDGRLFHNLSR